MLKMEELRDKNPFHCIITGPTNCGKTRYVIDQLRGSFRHVFDWIVLICPTYSKNKTYRGFAKGDKRFVVLDWQEQNRHEDAISAQNFKNTDEALKLYNKFHPDENMQINEPVFSDYYRPSKEQKISEMAYVSGGMMVLGYAASRWL